MENNTYDKIIAIEMIEAVGHEYLPQFFGTINDRLRPGGKAFLQVYAHIICFFPFFFNNLNNGNYIFSASKKIRLIEEIFSRRQ